MYVYKCLYLHRCFLSRTFSPTKPAKSLHTQKNRQFFHEPEENFWMVMVLMHMICIFLKHHIRMFSMHSALSNASLFHLLGCTKPYNRKTQRWKTCLWISGRRITGNTELSLLPPLNKLLHFKSSTRNTLVWFLLNCSQIDLKYAYSHKRKKDKVVFNTV